MTNRTGAGRPNKATYVTSYGETIHGAYKGKDGKLRPIGLSKPTFALTDESRAIHKFRLWQSQQANYIDPKVEQIKQHVDSFNGKTTWRTYYRNLILTDPRKAAIDLDIPHLADYPTKPEKPEFKLIDLAKNYVAKKKNSKTGKPVHRKWRDNVLLVWEPTKTDPNEKDKRKIKKRANMPKTSFLDVVKVDYIRDIRQSHIAAYRDAILKEFTEYNHSPSWVKTRYRAVKAILNFTQENAEENEKPEYQRVIALCNVLKEPSDTTNPSPIDPKHFRALVKAAKPREKAVMLLERLTE